MESNRIVFIVNVDWFFKSHRLPIALELIDKNYEVHLVSRNTGEFKNLQDYGIICHNVAFHRDFSLRNIFSEIKCVWQLYYTLFRVKPSIIYNVTQKPTLYSNLVSIFLNQKIKIINAVSGLGFLFINTKTSTFKRISISILSIILRRHKNSKFIFQNSDDLEIFRKKLKRDESFYLVKGSGVDECVFKKSRIKNPNNFITIGFLGRLIRDKGILDFIEVAKMLEKDYRHKCRFIIGGEVDSNNPTSLTEKELREMEVPKYLEWLGHINDPKKFYQDVDIACLPSYREGLPKSLVEAMAMECAIVTTDVPGCRDCVRVDINGLLNPLGDNLTLKNNIIFLINNPNKLESMKQESRKIMIEEMSLKKVLSQIIEIIES